MDYKSLTVEQKVKYVNSELLKDNEATIKSIAEEVGLANSTFRDSYKKDYKYNQKLRRIERKPQQEQQEEFKEVKQVSTLVTINKTITKPMKGIESIENNKDITKVQQQPTSEVLTTFNNDIDIKSMKELIGLIEPIKLVIQKYNEGITKGKIIDIDPVEIKIDRSKLNNNIKSVGFKLDSEVYDQWKEFTKGYQEIKNQDILGMALLEYMNKYNKL